MLKLTEDDFCPACGDIMEPDDVTGEDRCINDSCLPVCGACRGSGMGGTPKQKCHACGGTGEGK